MVFGFFLPRNEEFNNTADWVIEKAVLTRASTPFSGLQGRRCFARNLEEAEADSFIPSKCVPSRIHVAQLKIGGGGGLKLLYLMWL